MILFAYGHQSLQVTHYVILWIVLSRMVVQRDSFPGCPTQSFFLSLWFSQRVHRQPKALDEPTSGLSVITDNSEVDPPLRTEGVVIMLWTITYRSSATDVRDNDHPGP